MGKKNKLLTEVELEMMTILWSLEGATVNEVLERLPRGRELAYTSVSTILRILEQKKMVGSRKEGRGHRYFAKIKKAEYEAVSVHHLVTNVFGNEPVALVRRLLGTPGVSEAEIQQIKDLLNETSP